MWIQCTDCKLRPQECTVCPYCVCLKLAIWCCNTLFRMKMYIAGGRLVSYWVTFPSDLLFQFQVSMCNFVPILFVFQVFYYHMNMVLCTTCIWHTCFVKGYINHVWFFFTPWKAVILIFHVLFAVCQLTPSVGQVGRCAEVRENASSYFFLLIALNLCRSDCSPRELLPIHAVAFIFTSTEKMWKVIMCANYNPLTPNTNMKLNLTTEMINFCIRWWTLIHGHGSLH